MLLRIKSLLDRFGCHHQRLRCAASPSDLPRPRSYQLAQASRIESSRTSHHHIALNFTFSPSRSWAGCCAISVAMANASSTVCDHVADAVVAASSPISRRPCHFRRCLAARRRSRPSCASSSVSWWSFPASDADPSRPATLRVDLVRPAISPRRDTPPLAARQGMRAAAKSIENMQRRSCTATRYAVPAPSTHFPAA